MAPHTATTATILRRKRALLVKIVAEYEQRLERARADIAHIDATIAIFDAVGRIDRLFRRGEAMAICKKALRNGPLKARQMATCIMDAAGMHDGDALLRKAVMARLRNALSVELRRRSLVASGKHRVAWLWRLP